MENKQEVKTDKAPMPLGPYNQAIVVGDTIYVAGQGPADPATSVAAHKKVRAGISRVPADKRKAGSVEDRVLKPVVGENHRHPSPRQSNSRGPGPN